MGVFKYNIKFNLQGEAGKNGKPLRCYVNFHATKAVVKTGIIVSKDSFWDNAAQSIIGGSKNHNLDSQRQQLKNVRKWIDTTFDSLTDEKKDFPTPKEFRDRYEKVFKNKGNLPNESTPANYDVISYFEKFISESETGKRLNKETGNISINTITTYKATLKLIKRYVEFKQIDALSFNDIHLEFYFDFKEYFFSVLKFSANYFGTTIKILKTVMKEAGRDKLHENKHYLGERFVNIKVAVDNVYLTNEHLTTLSAMDLSENKRLERVRDLFLIGCWTGLRFSDFNNIKAENINGEFIDIKTQKTGEIVAIPILPVVKSIMERYRGITENSMPRAISKSGMNVYIKELCKEAGFTEPVTLSKNRAGMLIRKTQPLWELVSTHTARRTFASNAFKIGMPAFLIMSITGHRTEESFFTYIKIASREKGSMMREYWNREAMKAVI